ncbi:tRNA (adenosine(37)-N6)-threonylcarbamoyltransferase complex ATPase subunit type 1 TsaE [Enterococcus nangangensis]|uniref:tRNA (adenosine(37)-N6)-threonylcarbamoyltransferase complex ATPase subunit type 1 TsaE n=1 Tax=Enterococcus nangangensis TaxID=2559926 RepID=UPI0010F85F9E|nr:tRNA (adenosine(37)-N6)-threonylcarbamoyltransferase complex ATPase subunit type 1 TsaE [Enterococcus nangangensis]
MEYQLTSPEETQVLAAKLAQLVTPGTVLFLIGDLGAGKTTFTKGFALGLGIKQMIKSPSYTIIREYETGRLPFYHLDLYRLAGNNDDLGLEEYFEGEGVSVVEWANLLEELPRDYVTITFTKTSLEGRILNLKATGPNSTALLKKLAKEES